MKHRICLVCGKGYYKKVRHRDCLPVSKEKIKIIKDGIESDERPLSEILKQELPQEPNNICKIDVDLVRNLRFQKRFQEADELIKAHQRNLKENKKQTRKEIINLKNKIERFINKKQHNN